MNSNQINVSVDSGSINGRAKPIGPLNFTAVVEAGECRDLKLKNIQERRLEQIVSSTSFVLELRRR